MDLSSLLLLLCLTAAQALPPLDGGCQEAGKGSSCPEEADQKPESVELLQWQDGVRLVQESEAEASRPAELRRRAALCTHARASAMRTPPGSSEKATAEATLERMTAHPTSFMLQTQGCMLLSREISRDSGAEIVPYLTAMDDAIERAMAATPVNLMTAETCLSVLNVPAVFNRPFTLLLNSTTHSLEHVITLLKRFPDNSGLQERWLQSIAGLASYVAPELTPTVQALGGFDVLFTALENYRSNPNVQMSAWRGLSDHSHNPVGSSIIANHGGPMKGIEFIVNQQRIHPEPYLAESPSDHLTLKYEIMQIVNGMLEHDTSDTYGSAFVAAGFIPQMLYAMRVEPDLRGTQSVACSCMNSLLAHNASHARPLAQAGAAPLISAAVQRFRGHPDNTPWCGTTLGASYPVVPECSEALWLLTANES
mmetsp:Transcript_61766/g.149546  ORF Transcript_61766/g.149546 Transcript_61766/m.149546 type:complete len:424 (+) Transcript_61766:113-1384(+)